MTRSMLNVMAHQCRRHGSPSTRTPRPQKAPQASREDSSRLWRSLPWGVLFSHHGNGYWLAVVQMASMETPQQEEAENRKSCPSRCRRTLRGCDIFPFLSFRAWGLKTDRMTMNTHVPAAPLRDRAPLVHAPLPSSHPLPPFFPLPELPPPQQHLRRHQ